MAQADQGAAIEIQGLRKHYGRLAAVRGVDFKVDRGEMFGLIGPDGAGKTTIFQILAGVMEATSGQVQVLGQPPREARLNIGYLTQRFSLYLDLSLDENLRYSAGLRDVPQAAFQSRRAQYLKLMNLDQFPERLAGQLSGGMKQKLALCCALIAQPTVLLLDEPTTGVDPVSRREFWDILATLSDGGTTIMVATPYLDEAERCHRVALMYDGQIHEMGTPHQLRDRLNFHRLEVRSSDLTQVETVLLEASTKPGTQIQDVQTFGDRLDVLVPDARLGEQQVRDCLAQHRLQADSIRTAEPTLENVFVNRLRQQGSDPAFIPVPRQLRSPAHSPDTIAIGARQLRKTFGNFRAVDNVNLQVHFGEIYGLLGANGAGKTTTIKMLCGLLDRSSGDVILSGQTRNLRSRDLRRRIGYMSQKFTLYDDLSIRQNLEFYCGVYGVPQGLRRTKIHWVLEICGLTDQADMVTGQLPGGWKQRVAFGASVMHEPEILFLDEPTSGVDPLARRQFWRLIEDLTRQGTAVLVTTHYLEEAEHCNRMAFMVSGTIVAEGTPSDIKTHQPGQLFEIGVERPQMALNYLKQHFASWRVSLFGDRLHVVLDHPHEDLPRLHALLQAARFAQIATQPIPFSLEDAFIGIVQRAQAD
ncbi:MAG: ATP-binding cassette domain-containing protein [Thermosynechococcaceae cyanobacterium]